MLNADGVVKIGDLGLARLFSDPLQSLLSGDKVVVTIWYRAPELLLGGRHYTPAIDLWAVGCIFAELLALRPIFKGEEAKMNSKKVVPFQRNQFQKVIDILGSPTVDRWPALSKYPEYPSFQTLKTSPPNIESWYRAIDGPGSTSSNNPSNSKKSLSGGLDLLSSLLEYDPAKRLTAYEALVHPYFTEALPKVTQNVFAGQKYQYPARRISNEDIDIKATAYSGAKRSATGAGNEDDQIKKKLK